MPQEPSIKSLSYSKRQRFFFILCTLFAILLPTMIFYTTGYRIDLDDAENRIVTTGGMYITTDNLDVDVYLDDEQVRRPRLFRSAYYIQDIESGSHRVVVQQDGLHTWVKELPVDPYIVVEAAAFNMPLQAQVRHIPEFVTTTEVVVLPSASTSALFTAATTTDDLYFATTSATSTFSVNAEYGFVSALFSTSTASSTTLMERFMAGVERFGFATTTEIGTTTEFISFPTKGNLTLVERDSELYAIWNGSDNSIPYYFCVANVPISVIADRYGQHVAEQVTEQDAATTTEVYKDANRLCRKEVKIDRKRQDVLFYDFLPGASDLVLLHLEDGLYVSEIDDRAWQNTQQIYAGTDFTVVIENDVIYMQQDGLFFELLTEIPE